MYWSPASTARVCKYIAKGFECAVPGVRRTAFKDELLSTWQQYSRRSYGSWSKDYNAKGLGVLFQAEAEVLHSREYWSLPVVELDKRGEMTNNWSKKKSAEEIELIIEPIYGRLTKVEAATIASKCANKLGNGWKAVPAPPPRRSYGSDDEEYWVSTRAFKSLRSPFTCS
jgi:hypothetical protein